MSEHKVLQSMNHIDQGVSVRYIYLRILDQIGGTLLELCEHARAAQGPRGQESSEGSDRQGSGPSSHGLVPEPATVPRGLVWLRLQADPS
jgi:hypothetical protein